MTTEVHGNAPYRDDLLRAEKGRLNWSNGRIAKEAELSIPTVRAVLSGDPNVMLITVEKVARALGVPMQRLFEPLPETANA